MKAWVITIDYGYDCGRSVVGVASTEDRARAIIAGRCRIRDCAHKWCYDVEDYEMDVVE